MILTDKIQKVVEKRKQQKHTNHFKLTYTRFMAQDNTVCLHEQPMKY